MKRDRPSNGSEASLESYTLCLEAFEASLDRAEELIFRRMPKINVYPRLALQKQRGRLLLLCEVVDANSEWPTRILASEPLKPHYQTLNRRKGREEYRFMDNGRSDRPNSQQKERYVDLSIFGLSVRAWFGASDPPKQRTYHFVLAPAFEWTDPRTQQTVSLQAIVLPSTPLLHRYRPHELLDALRMTHDALQRRDQLTAFLNDYPVYGAS